MIRQTNPILVDLILNHPDVRPTIEQGDRRISCVDILADPENVIYASATGVVVFIHKGAGVYVGHIAFLPEGRGKAALKGCADALDQLFTDHGATSVLAAIPLQLRQARFLVRRLGFVPRGRDASKPVEHFKLEAIQWAG